jgi:hypothetical protein
MANENLGAARKGKNDEFYTQYHDIEKEMNAYLDFNKDVFRDKIVLLPCDDPEWSNFTKYFAQNFERLGLKKLISTSYAPDSKPQELNLQLTLFETASPKFDKVKARANGKIYTLIRDATGDKKIDVDDLEWEYLKGNGDFRSPEVSALRDEADIIITNPPFSLFREFLKWIVEADKKLVILGNKNAITYKEVFPLIKENKIWLGSTPMSVDLMFRVPESMQAQLVAAGKEGSAWRRIDGEVMGRSTSAWFTSLDHGRRHEPLELMTETDNVRFNKKLKGVPYKKYDNYDAIEVPFTDAIPADYAGVMGVPISFLSKHNPDQFEILGATQRGCHDAVPDIRKYDEYWEVKPSGEPTGSSGGKTNENANLEGNDGKKNYFTNKEGRVIQSAYQRIFVRHRRTA